MNKEICKKEVVYVKCKHKRREVCIDECEKCQFFNGYDDNNISIDCLYDDIPKLDLCRINQFVYKGYNYTRRPYDRDIDGEIVIDDYDEGLCRKCCFGKKLDNGKFVCTLTYAVDETCIDMFACNDDEIYVRSKIDVKRED